MGVPDTLVAALLGWLAAQGIGVPQAEAVTTRLASQGQMEALARGSFAESEVRRIGALYDPDTDTIVLPDAFDPTDPADQSLLLHELVHVAQDAAGAFDGCAGPCRDRLDRAAYRQQARWLKAQGEDLLSAMVEIQAMFATAPPHLILGRTPTPDDLRPPEPKGTVGGR